MPRVISDILSQIFSLDQVGYLLFQLEKILNVMNVISVELTKLVFVSFLGVGLDFFKPLNEIFVLNLRKHLGNESVEGWQD